MHVRREHYLLGLASLFGVLWAVALQVEHTSPGPLAATHARVPELSGSSSCKLCHGHGPGDMTAACGECHEPVLAQIGQAQGFHGTLADVDVEDCGACHLEHLGETFPLVSLASFREAGFEDREDYDHAELDFELLGRHSRLGCADCHVNADVDILLEGHTRFVGLDQNCASCHEDAHEGRIVLACASCHGQEHPFPVVAAFEHEDFATTCGHAAASCVECHEKDGPHDTELLAGANPPMGQRGCMACHESSHSLPFIVAVAVMTSQRPTDTCAACHDETHGTFLGHFDETPPEIHAASGFELQDPHNAVACGECHAVVEGDEIRPFVAQVPARQADDCVACHEDVHEGQFALGSFPEATCIDCHDRHEFLPPRFSLDAHEESAFPLEASHQAVACVFCHLEPEGGGPRQFQGTTERCADCHEDAHDQRFDEEPEGCATCHLPTLFSEWREDGFDHAVHGGMVLDGAHARADCESCHQLSPIADEAGRTFGRVADLYEGDLDACATCHHDPHLGRFDENGLAHEVNGLTGCARCHVTEAFTQVVNFEHERWTGYPMADFHREVECTECHIPTESPDAFGRTFGRSPTGCADCHNDPHVGQFAVAGRTECAQCHQDSGGITFDHQKDSRFQLDELHAKLECSACHVPWPLPGGGTAVRFKPLGVECVNCHDPEMLERPESQRIIRRNRSRDLNPRGGR
jgi:hypothetical protein